MKRGTAAFAASALLSWLALGLAGFYPLDNPDTFGHLALGRQIAELGHVPHYDTWSYFRSTPLPYVNYEWLSDRVLYAVYQAGGANALNAVKLVLLGALACILVAIVQLRAAGGGVLLLPCCLVAVLPAVRFRLSVRPHLFGLVLTALCLWGLSQLLTTPSRRQRWGWVVALSCVHVLWVNLHGSHLLGLALTLLAAISLLGNRGERARLVPIAVLFCAMLAASCISPYGHTIVSGAVAHVFDPEYRALIDEWQAWRSSESWWYPCLLAWQACWAGMSFKWTPPRAEPARRFECLYSLVLLLMAAHSLRFYLDALLLTAPAIAIGLAPRLAVWSSAAQRRLTGVAYVAALGLAIPGCLTVPPRTSFGSGESTRGRPAASAQWLRAHWPAARILAPMDDSWDLMFSLPQARFLIDGRAPFYGPAHLRRVQHAWASSTQLRALLDSTRTDVVVVRMTVTELQPALAALRHFPDFRLVSIEAEHCVFARVATETLPCTSATALHTLQPNYEPSWLLAPDLDVAAVHAELARLPAHPNVHAYREWVEGMLALRSLLPDLGTRGLVMPQTPAEHTQLRAALPRLRASDRELGSVQTVTLYHALASLAECQLDEAREAFDRAQQTGPVRELILGEQELALQRGDRPQVREFLSRARALPAAHDDAWLASLQARLDARAPCAP